jgi:hypothetical protein
LGGKSKLEQQDFMPRSFIWKRGKKTARMKQSIHTLSRATSKKEGVLVDVLGIFLMIGV